MTQDFLDGLLVALIPSMLMLAWLVWRMPSDSMFLTGLICRLDHVVDKLTSPYPRRPTQIAVTLSPKPITACRPNATNIHRRYPTALYSTHQELVRSACRHRDGVT